MLFVNLVPFGLGSNGGNIRFGQRTSSTGHPTLAEVEYITPGNAIIEASKPSLRGELTINQRYENPGHHDPNLRSIGRGNVKYNPTKSVLPDNHVELFKNSIPFKKPNGEVYRYAQDEFGNIHRFEPSSNGINDYHWSGSTNSRTLSGEPTELEYIPPEVRRAFK